MELHVTVQHDHSRLVPVSDHLGVPLSAVPTRAANRHRHVVVVDNPDGATTAGLREHRRAAAGRPLRDRPAAGGISPPDGDAPR